MSQNNRFDRYNKEHPPKSIRLDKEIWAKIPSPKGPWITKTITSALNEGPSPDQSMDFERNRLLLFLIKQFVEMGLTLDFPDDELAELIVQIIPEALQ